MTLSINEVQSFAAKAARGAGFPVAQSALFGQAAAWQVALGADTDALGTALEDPGDSPILRLPLLLEDIRRAGQLTGPDLTLSFHANDSGLIHAYLRLLPMATSGVQITQRTEGPPRLQLRLEPRASDMSDMPARLSLPAPLLTRMRKLAALRLVPASETSRRGAGA